MTEKLCISCGEKGHHYNECPKVNFWDLVGGAFGVALPSGKTQSELAADINDAGKNTDSAFATDKRGERT